MTRRQDTAQKHRPMTDKFIPCPGCGAKFPDHDGPTHRYLESSPACWAAYGEVLAREYSDPEYMAVHHLTVDAYSVQHPGKPSRQTIHSLAVHLISLYAALELGLPHKFIRDRFMSGQATSLPDIHWLPPPEELGDMTVADLLPAGSAEEHARLVKDWAQEAWEAWSVHHEQVERWVKSIHDH